MAALIGNAGARLGRRPPYLMLHGDADRLAPLEQSRRRDAALRAAGMEHSGAEFFKGDAPRQAVRPFFLGPPAR